MRTIDVSEVTKLVRQLCMDANYYLPADLRQAFVDGQQAEQSPLGREIFGEMIANCDLARQNGMKLHSWTLRKDSLPKGFKDFNEVLDVSFKQLKVDGMFSDFPDILVEYFKANNLR